MSSILTEIFNKGEDITPIEQPDGKTKFLLDDDEIAFINVINMQKTVLKTLLLNVMSAVEEQLDAQTAVLIALREQFIAKMGQKRGIDLVNLPVEIDLANKLCVIQTDKIIK